MDREQILQAGDRVTVNHPVFRDQVGTVVALHQGPFDGILVAFHLDPDSPEQTFIRFSPQEVARAE